jgi:pilus assembly protein CpaB
MNRRALFTGLIVAALFGALLLVSLRRYELDKSGGAAVRLLVAQRPIDRGQPLTASDLAVREVPQAYAESRAVRASDRDRILGLALGTALETEQMLLWTDLEIAEPERRELASLVTPGYRAVYVHAMHDDEGSALVRPGDYVDVIATLETEQNFTVTNPKTAVVLLQKVLVLASGPYTSPVAVAMAAEDKSKPRLPPRDLGLTLSLNIEEAELVSLATALGQLSVAVRGPDDTPTGTLVPDVSASAVLDKKPRVAKRMPESTMPVRLVEPPPPPKKR